MARRLMKALEDLSMQYDKTVRNSEQIVVQFSYGNVYTYMYIYMYVYVFIIYMI